MRFGGVGVRVGGLALSHRSWSFHTQVLGPGTAVVHAGGQNTPEVEAEPRKEPRRNTDVA